MDKEHLFKYLKKQKKDILFKLLESSYEGMDVNQRHNVFGEIIPKIPPKKVIGEELLEDIKDFYKDSINQVYYAPFDINSKNFMDIPEETDEWFEILGDFLKDSTLLSKQGEHSQATNCFEILYKLIDKMECGEEIVFADELGGWMIPGNEEEFIEAYITSLMKCQSPKEFTESVIPLLKSFGKNFYSITKKVTNKKYMEHLKSEMRKQKITVSSL